MIKAIKNKLLFFLGFFLFFSCSPEKKLTKLQRKYPYLFLQKTDTIFFIDTVLKRPFLHDTFWVSKNNVDTFLIEKEKVKIKFIKHRDTFFVNTILPADTIVLEKKIPVEKMVVKNSKNYAPALIYMILSFLIVFLLGLLSGNRR